MIYQKIVSHPIQSDNSEIVLLIIWHRAVQFCYYFSYSLYNLLWIETHWYDEFKLQIMQFLIIYEITESYTGYGTDLIKIIVL